MCEQEIRTWYVKRAVMFALVCLLASSSTLRAADPVELEKKFITPPDSAKPWVYWWWLNGNVSKEGITADFEAMARIGIGGALWMTAYGQESLPATNGPVNFMDEQWWQLMRHTVREADRLGLKINLTNGEGWSHSGGPWVKPEYGMQDLYLDEEFLLTGPVEWERNLKREGLVGVVAYQAPESKASGQSTSPVLGLESALDLKDKIDAEGTLRWEVPAGACVVKVFRYKPNMRPTRPGDYPNSLECDKLNPAAIDAHWQGFVRRVLDECGPEARRVVRWAHVDSYEVGPITWSPAFRDEFRKRCGYDLLPYLPTVLGQTVGSQETTARFLWDFKRVCADLFAENIGGHLRALAQKDRLSLTTEPHQSVVFDQMQYGGHVSEPFGATLAERNTGWFVRNPRVGPESLLVKGESSAAYTYGLNGVVWAEMFPGVDYAHAWKETPAYLRTWGDLWFSEGVNRFCIISWVHSPSLTQRPGLTLGGYGMHFERGNTWTEYAAGYVSYISRSQYLLQQGLPVVDVVVFNGDGITSYLPGHPELRACGYDYHGLTAEILMQAKVVDGLIVLPSGMRYRLLVTYNREMRPATIRKLHELVEAGGVVLGVKPETAPGLTGYPNSVDEVKQVADKLWGVNDVDLENKSKGRSVGKGRLFWGEPEAPVNSSPGTSGYGGLGLYDSCARELAVLHAIGVVPDFEYAGSGKEACEQMVAYQHRRLKDMDLYFVSNQADRQRREECVFRISGLRPELWDAVTGEMRELPVFRQEHGRTMIPLEFALGQSFFIVFRKTAEAPTAQDRANFVAMTPVAELVGPWQVSFDPRWGGPDKPVTFTTLEDWTTRPENGIKYYSGSATYRTSFECPSLAKNKRVYLDLGVVKDLADVCLNGKRLGSVWCAPWRIEITDAVRAGSNDLELVLVNQWVNRLIGDSALPQKDRFTWTTHNPYNGTSSLLPSGLLGPVRVVAE